MLRRRWWLALTVMVSTGLAFSSGTDVSFEDEDGHTLEGRLYEASGRGPAILLLDPCEPDHGSLDQLGDALAQGGFHALRYDSGGAVTDEGGSERVSGSERAQRDRRGAAMARAAVAFLREQPRVDAETIGVIAAGCGSAPAMRLAMALPEVATVVFLSSSGPKTDHLTLEWFLGVKQFPQLFVTSVDDRSYKRTFSLFRKATSPHCRLIIYKGHISGTALFDHDPELANTIIAWMKRHL
ncbi:MAG: hypothetical protein JSV80_11875 [Acidobacteriota bacterium]|nr:MAG: hypothetical protein JSV80_11875 [Acidobacteriota bacterium]